MQYLWLGLCHNITASPKQKAGCYISGYYICYETCEHLKINVLQAKYRKKERRFEANGWVGIVIKIAVYSIACWTLQ